MVDLERIEGEIQILSLGTKEDFFSFDIKCRLIDMEGQKCSLLRIREETKRKKSHAVWMVAGDHNTKYFHRFPVGRKVNNAVWDMKNSQGELITGNSGLKELYNEYFMRIY